MIKKQGFYDEEKKRFYLGDNFCNEYLTRRELEIFRYILYGFTLDKIALILTVSVKTIRWNVKNIRQKLQARSIGEIMSIAIKFGLTYILDEYKIWTCSKEKKLLLPK